MRVRSTLDLPQDQATIRDEIPVTTPTRTLVDLAGAAGRAQLSRAIEAAEYRELLDVPSLLVVSAGRSGAAVIRELVSEELPHTRSDFEAAFVDLCDRYGLPRPVMNAVIAGHEVDAVWPDHKLIVELDSWRHHGTRAAFERDRERDADLHAAGYVSQRLTYRQVTARSGWVAARLRPSFAPRSRRGSSSSRRSAA
jgi:very-short-patch-repair endonuclease